MALWTRSATRLQAGSRPSGAVLMTTRCLATILFVSPRELVISMSGSVLHLRKLRMPAQPFKRTLPSRRACPSHSLPNAAVTLRVSW